MVYAMLSQAVAILLFMHTVHSIKRYLLYYAFICVAYYFVLGKISYTKGNSLEMKKKWSFVL